MGRHTKSILHYNANNEQKGASMIDWEKLKAEYVAGDTSYRKLCAKYNVGFTTLKEKARKEQWTQLRERCDTKTDTEIVEIVSKERAKDFVRLMDVTDKLLALVEKAINAASESEEEIDKSFFKQLSGTLKDIKDIKSNKSELDIEEQRAKIDLLKKQAEVGTKTDPTVVVKFEDGVSEWAK